ncbi:fructosamine kinase family protein [Spirillospora sp. NBC_01491]|uniref:fructosamine kinase family protein n=1 Tax=Spirillospora sp. NBC_01491 TaxID=2976007 RepID=UPI002E33C77E|nr:fructosamine kinase family protein [Spirillospora sp. NBC_01491]
MRERVAALLGTRVERVSDLGSSHSWTLHRVALADGREVFVKAASGRAGGFTGGFAGVFAAEAAGLRWLAEAGPGSPVPAVLAVDDDLLVLPWLPSGPPTPEAAERLGRELAVLHTAAPPSAYGAPWEGYIADLPLDNTPDGRDWPRWYAERRLEPFLRRAARHLGPDGTRLVERVADGIDGLAGPPEPRARVHGDLWSGNVRWGAGGRALVIDPAAHGGHRETDLAMLALFGAPGLDRVLAAYDETAPLAPGWRERVPLHQLYPLLVHVALFGTSYSGATIEAAMAALAAG